MNDIIKLWHERARPEPTAENFNVQLGCHFEEIWEMMDSIECDDIEVWMEAKLSIYTLSKLLKIGELKATIFDRKEMLDSLADQIVTSVGVGHCANMNIVEAVHRVNSSNWSKYNVDGKPIFNENGKIAKGPNYAPPDLEGLY